ncbi:hypothetical protein PAMA_013958 [Pampus argenteus]
MQRCSINQNPSKEDYTSVYKNDFKAWKSNKAHDYLKTRQGLHVTDGASKKYCRQKVCVPAAANSPQVQKPVPFESLTIYRSDYITHPVQAVIRRVRPVFHTNTGLPLEPAVSFGRQGDTQGKAAASGPQADHNRFLSTTHRDYTAREHTKRILPSMQTCEKSKEPLQVTTSEKKDYKVWDKKLNCPKKTTFCVSEPASHADTRKTNPKLEQTGVCNPNCNTTEEPQRPAENGTSSFKCISTGTDGSRLYWATCMNRGANWFTEGLYKELSPTHQSAVWYRAETKASWTPGC